MSNALMEGAKNPGKQIILYHAGIVLICLKSYHAQLRYSPLPAAMSSVVRPFDGTVQVHAP